MALKGELAEFKAGARKEVSQALRDLLKDIAESGQMSYSWDEVKPVIGAKLQEDLRQRREEKDDLEQETFEDVSSRLESALDSFAQAPFTLQRLCELLSGIKPHYKSLRKFSFAVEKALSVTMTIPADHLTGTVDFAKTEDTDDQDMSEANAHGTATPHDAMDVDDSSTEDTDASTTQNQATNSRGGSRVVPPQ